MSLSYFFMRFFLYFSFPLVGFSFLHLICAANTSCCSLFLFIVLLLHIIFHTYPFIQKDLGFDFHWVFLHIGFWVLLLIGLSSLWAFGYGFAKISINNIYMNGQHFFVDYIYSWISGFALKIIIIIIIRPTMVMYFFEGVWGCREIMNQMGDNAFMWLKFKTL